MKIRLIGLFILLILSSIFVSAEVIEVECTRTSVCIEKYGSEYVCDLSPANYGKCIKRTTGPYCGDGKCDGLYETKTDCPQDCNPDYELEQKIKQLENKSDKTPYIIGAFILVGLLVIAYVNSKKKK